MTMHKCMYNQALDFHFTCPGCARRSPKSPNDSTFVRPAAAAPPTRRATGSAGHVRPACKTPSNEHPSRHVRRVSSFARFSVRWSLTRRAFAVHGWSDRLESTRRQRSAQSRPQFSIKKMMMMSIASFGRLLKMHLFQLYSVHRAHYRHCAIMRIDMNHTLAR